MTSSCPSRSVSLSRLERLHRDCHVFVCVHLYMLIEGDVDMYAYTRVINEARMHAHSFTRSSIDRSISGAAGEQMC